jgi:GR25 family glycosyltransferase involved in LPS biosynthesis
MNTLKIYVIHYTKLIERKKILLNEFEKYYLNYDFIEQYDREKLLENDLSIFDNKLPKSHCAITLSHIYAYTKIINSMYKYNLIFEDDVVLDKNFSNKLKKGLNELPDDYDMLFIGNCCNLHIPTSMIDSSKCIYNKSINPTPWGGNGATRGTDSYLVSKTCAKKLIKYINNLKKGEIQLPSDWWLNKVIRDLNLKIYWMEPNIVTQGTRIGKYNSSH